MNAPGQRTVEIYDDAAELCDEVARLLLAEVAAVQATGRAAHLGLTGGGIADQLHRRLAELSEDSQVDWSGVVVWWGDERFVTSDDSDRNARQARAALLDHVAVDPAQVHEVPADAGQGVEEAAATYGSTLREHGAGEFDVLMLGIGPDGHCASLFPGSPLLDADDAVAVAVTDAPKPPPTRVSLTLGALNRSREVWFLASGAEKADAVARAVGGDDVHDTPAAGVEGRLATRWFVDVDAAVHLRDD